MKWKISSKEIIVFGNLLYLAGFFIKLVINKFIIRIYIMLSIVFKNNENCRGGMMWRYLIYTRI